MQLHAVIVPPPGVVQGALEAAGDLIPPTSAATEEPRRRLLDRFLARRQVEPAADPAVTLAPLAPDAVFVRLAKFGNVTTSDAAGLATALEAVSSTWPAPVLQVTSVRVAAAHPHEVTAQLDGDVDALRDIYRNVNEVARLQRFFLDRRSFRSELALGSLDAEAGATPEGVAGSEVPHEGARWSPSHVTLLRTSYVDGGTSFAEVARVALARGAESGVAGSGSTAS